MSSSSYLAKLKDRSVIVFGGSSGIGFAVAQAVLELGGRVIVSSSQQKRVDDAVQRLQSFTTSAARVSGYVCNLHSPDLDEHLKDLFEKVGKVDHIVVTAGDALSLTKIEDWTAKSITDSGRVRFLAPLLIAKHGAKNLNVSAKSSMTFTGAALAEKPRPGWAIESAYAMAMHGAAKALAIDLKPVRVNVVDPFATRTEMWGEHSEEEYTKLKASVEKETLTGIWARPEDVAEAYIYLMRDANATGSVVNTNSGWPLV